MTGSNPPESFLLFSPPFLSILLSTNKTKTEIAKRILHSLDKQDFADWYEKDFDSYVVGDEGAKSEAEILMDIKDLFRL